MIAHEFDYVKPASLAEALDLLADENAKPLSGGMSLIPMMKLRLAIPGKLVDLTGIEELKTLEMDGSIQIGALTTHYEIESSELIRKHCPLLAETAAQIGDVQVRNMGTIGGAAAHNDPSADYPAALLALNAGVRLASKGGIGEVPYNNFLVDALTTKLEPGQIITHIIVPSEAPGTGTCYKKVPQAASGYAVVGIAVRIRREGGVVTHAYVGVTGLASVAFRAGKVEQALMDGASAADAAALIAEGVDAMSDVHVSAEYRKHLARVQAARAITTALGRC
jgi:carbon-monoxide dehydrogenase medium subunit